MKDYQRQIIWIDYFNSALSRAGGRKIPRHLGVRHPTLSELVEAARRIGLAAEPSPVRHPQRSTTASGYIAIPKTERKTAVLHRLAQALAQVRGAQPEPKPRGR